MAIDVKSFLDALLSEDCDLFCGVPDSLLSSLSACALDVVPPERNIICANEGNAVGMACGWHMATGHYGVVYTQNSGEGNTVNPLLSIADPDVYSIPMLLVIGWRGEPGVHDEPQHVKQGKVTCELLACMGIPYEVLDEEDWKGQLSSILLRMREEGRPVALVVRKGALSAWLFEPEDNGFPLSREEALEKILALMGPEDLVVSTTGKESREVFEIRERRSEGHERDFLTVGGMGHTLSIAAGLALGTPERLVWCLDGDGSMLMHMGSLPVLAQRWPENLRYVVNVNGAHESVGGQPNVAAGIDLSRAFEAFGLDEALEARTQEEIVQGMHLLSERSSNALILYTHQGSREDLGRPTSTPQQNKEALMRELGTFGGDA